MKTFALLLLLTIQIVALETIKAKAKEKNNIVEVKMLIVQKDIKPNYVTKVVTHVGNEIVYDATISKIFSKYIFLKFKYPYIGRSNKIKITVINNKGAETTYSTLIKKSSFVNNKKKRDEVLNSSSTVDFRKTHPSVWNKLTINEAIIDLYGSKPMIQKHIEISSRMDGDYHPDDYNIVGIKTDQKFESIAMFIESASEPALVAMFNTSNNEAIDYNYIKLKRLKNHSKVIAVGKGIDGKLYKSETIPFNVPSWLIK